MIPLIHNATTVRNPRWTALKAFFAALAVMLAGGVLLVFSADSGDTPVAVFIFALAVIGIAVSVAALVVTRLAPAKSKRGLAGLDMYTMIDRLVDDLDDDEAAYVQRRLDEREAKQKDNLTLSLNDLLEQRTQEKRLE